MNDFISTVFSAFGQLILFTLIPFIWWLATGRKTGFFQWIGLKKPQFKGSVLKIWAIVIGACAVYTGAMILVMSFLMGETPTATSQFAGKGISAMPSILIYAVIQTGLSEELFFRGFLCKRLAKHFGFAKGNTIQAFCFGLLHGIPFGLATGKIAVCVLLTLLPAAVGYLQGWLNEKKAGGSVLPSWALHSLMNILSAAAQI